MTFKLDPRDFTGPADGPWSEEERTAFRDTPLAVILALLPAKLLEDAILSAGSNREVCRTVMACRSLLGTPILDEEKRVWAAMHRALGEKTRMVYTWATPEEADAADGHSHDGGTSEGCKVCQADLADRRFEGN